MQNTYFAVSILGLRMKPGGTVRYHHQAIGLWAANDAQAYHFAVAAAHFVYATVNGFYNQSFSLVNTGIKDEGEPRVLGEFLKGLTPLIEEN